jgi:hypothetical protein
MVDVTESQPETQKGSPKASFLLNSGAGEESRTLDLNLGKVALYQLSYSRLGGQIMTERFLICQCRASTFYKILPGRR